MRANPLGISLTMSIVALALALPGTVHAGPVISEVSVVYPGLEEIPFSRVESGVNSAGMQSGRNDIQGPIVNYLGQASAEFQTLRAKMEAGGIPALWTTDYITSSRFKTTTVVAGANVGAATQLDLMLKMDGLTRAMGFVSPTSVPINSTRQLELLANSTLRYRIFDLSDLDGETNKPKTLLDFNFGSGILWNAWRTHLPDGSHSDGSRVSESTVAECAVGCQPGPDPWRWSGNWGTDETSEIMPGAAEVLADTGLLVFAFEAIMGHELLIEASLDAFVSHGGCGVDCMFSAGSDYSQTFDAELTARDPAVQLIGLRAGVAEPLGSGPANAVPEPASLALALIGALAIGGTQRRKARRQRSGAAARAPGRE